MKHKHIYLFLILIILSIITIICAMSVGPVNLSFKRIISIIFDWAAHPFSYQPDSDGLIILQIRMPRVVLAFTVGAGLACVGSVYQGLLGNPLADPYILGSSSGAALGASCAMVVGFASVFFIPVSAFIGSAIALVLVYILARIGNRLPLQTLLLSGVVVNAFLFAVVMFILSMAGRDSGQILMWLLGSLSTATPLVSLITVVITVCGSAIILTYAWDINIISLGEEKALQLGINTERVKKILLIITSLIIGAVVSASGLIGFVGLIVPHIVRLMIGPDMRKLIPGSLLAGGIFLVLSDTVAKAVIEPQELPVGVITALCGAPFFLYLLRKTGKTHV